MQFSTVQASTVQASTVQASTMLHQMCHDLLAGPDVKALCKVRGFPSEASASLGILETLFLSSQGLSDSFATLDAKEVALLHLLKNSNKAVDVSFFASAYGDKSTYGTFNQRYQDCFAKVKQRLVRSGVLLMGEVSSSSRTKKKSRLERCRFALPTDFHPYLPRLIQSSQQFEGDGNWRANVVRDQMIADLRPSKHVKAKSVFKIEAGELLLHDKPFRASKLIVWQQESWRQAMGTKKIGRQDSFLKQPDEAVLSILADLPAEAWIDAEQLAEPLAIFCGRKLDVTVVCETGWEYGLLSKRKAQSKNWVRLAPPPSPVPPQDCLTDSEQENGVVADLTTVPFEMLEQVAAISDLKAGPEKAKLLLTPNFFKLGRSNDGQLASGTICWLLEQTRSFAEASVRLSERRGKTILHENVYVAKVSDLSLQVAIKKALGPNFVVLKNDFVAFPHGLLGDVQRVVKKSGHVIKEVSVE